MLNEMKIIDSTAAHNQILSIMKSVSSCHENDEIIIRTKLVMRAYLSLLSGARCDSAKATTAKALDSRLTKITTGQ